MLLSVYFKALLCSRYRYDTAIFFWWNWPFSTLWSHLFLVLLSAVEVATLNFFCLVLSLHPPSSFAFSFPAHALGLCLKNKRKLDSPLLNYIEVLPTLVFHQLQPPHVCRLESRTSVSDYVWNLTVCVMSSGVQCCLPHSEQSKELSMPLIPATFLLAYTQLFGILGFTFCLLNSH